MSTSILCYLGIHKPSVHTMARGKRGGYQALCDCCGVPVERADSGSWRAAGPITVRAH